MNDLETRLRDALTERSRDIAALPPEFGDVPALAQRAAPAVVRHRSAQHTLLVAAAVVAVLALAGTLTALRATSSKHHPLANRSTHTTQPLPPAPVRTECTTALPPAWRTALSTPLRLGGATDATPLAVDSDGTALVSRTRGAGKDVGLVRAGGSFASLFTIPDPARLDAFSGALDGSYAIVPLIREYANQTTARSSGPVVVRLELIDVHTGRARQIAGTKTADLAAGRNLVTSAVDLDGTVYWSVRANASAATARLIAYDLGTGRSRTIYTGPVGDYLVAGAAGVSGYDQSRGTTIPLMPRALPAEVAAATDAASAATVDTDGHGFAWFDARRGRIGWWAPGQPVRPIAVGPGAQPDGNNTIPAVHVAGSYVFFQSATHAAVLDVRTGASARLPDGASVTATAGGHAVVNLPADRGPAIGVVDTAPLPELHC